MTETLHVWSGIVQEGSWMGWRSRESLSGTTWAAQDEDLQRLFIQRMWPMILYGAGAWLESIRLTESIIRPRPLYWRCLEISCLLWTLGSLRLDAARPIRCIWHRRPWHPAAETQVIVWSWWCRLQLVSFILNRSSSTRPSWLVSFSVGGVAVWSATRISACLVRYFSYCTLPTWSV